MNFVQCPHTQDVEFALDKSSLNGPQDSAPGCPGIMTKEMVGQRFFLAAIMGNLGGEPHTHLHQVDTLMSLLEPIAAEARIALVHIRHRGSSWPSQLFMAVVAPEDGRSEVESVRGLFMHSTIRELGQSNSLGGDPTLNNAGKCAKVRDGNIDVWFALADRSDLRDGFQPRERRQECHLTRKNSRRIDQFYAYILLSALGGPVSSKNTEPEWKLLSGSCAFDLFLFEINVKYYWGLSLVSC
ncbi:hypothetical protein B0H14DRAFT_2573896 [Mycena olivaceomarginata]|nr:hypothetical protein B0H14DRAFT_2573896 [Mycena olivaceomarginata]